MIILPGTGGLPALAVYSLWQLVRNLRQYLMSNGSFSLIVSLIPYWLNGVLKQAINIPAPDVLLGEMVKGIWVLNVA